MRQMNGKDEQRHVPLYTPLKSSFLGRILFRSFVNTSKEKPAGKALLTIEPCVVT